MLRYFSTSIKNTVKKSNNSEVIHVTKNAWEKINSILKTANNDSMILSIDSVGCNGFNYNLNILDKNIYTKYENLEYVKMITEKMTMENITIRYI